MITTKNELNQAIRQVQHKSSINSLANSLLNAFNSFLTPRYEGISILEAVSLTKFIYECMNINVIDSAFAKAMLDELAYLSGYTVAGLLEKTTII